MTAPSFTDCHVHIVAPAAQHPLAAARTYTPGPAPLARLRALAQPGGITRFVIVQPSFYGTDNTVTLAALEELGGNGRGVAVVDPATATPHALAEMNSRGVRGLRLNLYSPAGGPMSLEASFHATAALALAQGWHVQVIAPLPVLAAAAPLLAAAPVPVVIDHYGLPNDATPGSPHGAALLALLQHPHIWIKLSAPYRSGPDPHAITPNAPWLAALLATAPDRCVWGSDWPWTPPHAATPSPDTPLPYRELDYAAAFQAFRAALPDDETAQRVLQHNPARLYAFT